MRLQDVTIPMQEVEGYPQLKALEPSLTDLAVIAEKFKGYDPAENAEESSKTTLWFFSEFIRAEDGSKIEGVDEKNIHDHVTNGMMLACIQAVKGKTPSLDEVPQE